MDLNLPEDVVVHIAHSLSGDPSTLQRLMLAGNNTSRLVGQRFKKLHMREELLGIEKQGFRS